MRIACFATLLLILGPGALLTSCNRATDKPDAGAQHDMGHTASGMAHAMPGPGAIPAALAPFGKGYPQADDPCRRLGESPATAQWLADGALLVGCPDPASAKPLGGRIVATVNGVTLVLIPLGGSGVAMSAAERQAFRPGDALVPGTKYDATTRLLCATRGASLTKSCPAGVIRNWSHDGTTLVDVVKADGRMRKLFFRDGAPLNADGSEADGTAGWSFTSLRKGNAATIHFGPESYVVPDSLVKGG